MGKEDKKEKATPVVVAGYKVHLHCPQCAEDIRKPLLRTTGVHSVDVKYEKNEVIIKGAIDEKIIHTKLEKWSKKKVEILTKDKIKIVEVKEKETKKETVKTTTMKSYIHCDQCERDLRNRLIKHRGIHDVKTDRKAHTITIEGTIESEKLLTYMQKKVHKHAEIIQKKDDNKEKVEFELKSTEITKVSEFKEEIKVEARNKDGNVPYFVHAPQLFSDENPNACSVM
ncbi:HMA domain-containing protein [Heracleum sosnowskyi]|uniref:HMA domain-containing protein n=1 Tax=Heracleum sosnowskyi TaxID=360622 RepID=A0AAD8JFB8_9APIA|nr:HMA domain-containing protein [Heracleum sosnowskyi]